MKLFRHIVLLISFLWIAEDVVSFIHLSQTGPSVAIELSGEEKLEKVSEYEIKEFLSNEYGLNSITQNKIKIVAGANLYQAPILSIPDVPPEQS